jgi:hypothetical protein
VSICQTVFLARSSDLRQLPGQPVECQLLLGEIVGLGEQRFEALTERIELLRQHADVLVLQQQGVHAPFGIADAVLQHA